MIMAVAVLCLGILLGTGSRMEGEDIIPSSSRGTAGAYAMPGPIDASTEAYVMPSSSSEETEKYSMPFSYSEETGAYFMPGIFGRWRWGWFMPEFPDWDSLIPSSGEETEEDLRTELSDEEREKIINELMEFCKEHKEKLNEMSEYFINEVEDISDYRDEEKLPDIEELAGSFTDEEGREILEQLELSYTSRYYHEPGVRHVYFYYGKWMYPNDAFMIVYIEADGEKLERVIDGMYDPTWYDVRKIDKRLYVVNESWPLE